MNQQPQRRSLVVARGGQASAPQTRRGDPLWSPRPLRFSVRGRGAKRTQGMPGAERRHPQQPHRPRSQTNVCTNPLCRPTNLTTNTLTGCIPSALRNIDENDLSTLRLQYCTTP